LLNAKATYSPHLGVFYRIDAIERRHNLSDYDKFLEVVDISILANIELLKMAGGDLTYNHRRILMTSYLEQKIKKIYKKNLNKQISKRIESFRPSFFDACSRRDFVVLASYFLPYKVLGIIQKNRRK
jgi:hypothetical protein